MGINQFGSFGEYVRQVYEVPRDGGVSGTMIMGGILHLATLICFLTGLFSGFDGGVGVGLAVLLVITLFLNGVPLFHSEYGAGKKQNF